MRAEWSLVTGPAQEPLTLAEAKQHCSITQDDDNGLVAAYIIAAREAAQAYLQRALFTQTWKLELSNFAEAIWLPMAAPLASVTHVKYYDADDTLQTLSASYYVVNTTSEPGTISRASGMAWPSVSPDRRLPVAITYVAGWSSVEDIPELIKQGMRLHVAAADVDRTGGGDSTSFGGASYSQRAVWSLWDAAGKVYWREPETCRS